MKRLLPSLILFLFFQILIFAQSPQVVSVSPVNQVINAQAEVPITIEFDMPLDLSSVDYSNFKVFGRWSGPAELAFSMSNNNQTVEMTPFEPFFAGEWVTVILTKGVKSMAGDYMDYAYIWNFWIETGPGIFNQPKIETIELRESGEGWLQAYGAYAGDLNNDGFSDLTVIDENSDDLRILLNDGQGSFGAMEIIPMGNLEPSPNEGADFNNDGEIDLAVCTAHNDEVRVLFGDGSGTLSDMEIYNTESAAARGLGIVEVNGDGYDDIIIANRDGNDMTLLTNNGDGTFTISNFDPPGTGESGLVVTDANNDGIQDIFIGMYSSEEIVLMLGDGDGGFTFSDNISVTGKPWMLAVGDLNDDGFADIVSANSFSSLSAVVLNDGNGGFESVEYLNPAGTDFAVAIDLGDIDGDGDLDIVTSYYGSANYGLFENDGLGNFTFVNFLEATGNASCAILHDRDNDGDLDITGTDETDDRVFLFENNPPLDAIQIPDDILNFKSFPNPFADLTNIQLELKENAEVKVLIYNVLGKLVWSNTKSGFASETLNFQWNGSNQAGRLLSNGIYLVDVFVNGKSFAFKLNRL
jgi:hypothetical protein